MIGKFLIYTGIILVLAGLVVLYAEKLNFFGKLPGDIVIRRENFTFYLPLMSSILLSLLLSLLLYIFHKLR